jgi:hypothetical protein
MIVGHRKQRASYKSIGFLHCSRCLHITDQITVRRRETKGDMERVMQRIAIMTGYIFTGINWKKRMPNGRPYTVQLAERCALNPIRFASRRSFAGG